MELQGRNLSMRMQGEDVALLQEELRKLGFSIDGRDGYYGKTTRQAVMEFQRRHEKEPTGVVDEVTAKLINDEVEALQPEPEPVEERQPFTVRGQVHQADGSPLVGGIVRAFDKDMRNEEPLGEATTDNDGHYEIQYTADQFRRTEKKSADLIVRVFNRDGSPLVSSPIFFNAPPVATVDLVIGGGEIRGPSEFERYVAELTPVLQGVPFAELREDEDREDNRIQDVTFLTGETGINPLHIAFVVIAHRLARQTDLPPEVFYGFFRQNLPTRLPALLSQHPQVLRRALETAIRDNIIPARLSNELDNIPARLQELIVEHAFEEPEIVDKYSLSALLGTARVSQELQRKFLTQYVQHEGAIEDFWKTLRETPEFSASGVVEKLQYALQLGALTGNHLPLVEELQQDETIKSLRDLAELDGDAWLERIKKEVDGKPIGFPPDIPGRDEEKAGNYAKAMTRIIEDAFPTAVIAHRMEADNSTDAPFKAEVKGDLLKFFSNNPDFEFGSTNIEKYLRENAETALAGITDKEGLKQRLKSMQRLLKVIPRLTPRYDAIKVLLIDGIHSAQSIARMSRGAFIRKYSDKLDGQTRAKTLYAKAHQTAAMALTLFGKYAEPFYSLPSTPQSVSNIVTGKAKTADIELIKAVKEAFPNWTTLFGSPVLCECEHCRSVYSPTSYLVDILYAFLKNIPSAQNILFKRRPDIEHIELSCENTNTPLPYVDLVNEILENAISPWPWTTFDASGAYQNDLDNRIIPQGLQQEFTGHGITLSPNAKVSVVEEGYRWLIEDVNWTYTLQKDIDPVSKQPFIHITSVPQTHWTAEELSANPEYINQKAYDILSEQVYPFDLPLNLWVEEARAYLEHLGVRRHELIETFHKEAPPSELTDISIASEYLRLTTMERDIIAGAASQQPWEFWGLAENNNTVPDPTDPADNDKNIKGTWIEVLSHVTVFLQRARLSYKELVELLGTKFINPNQVLDIDTDPSVTEDEKDTCDPSKLIIAPLDQMALGRMHRFLRLWRKLAWTMRELDKAITGLQPTDANNNVNLTEDFLKQLSHIQRLRTELKKVPLINMLSWWASIDTANHDDGTKSLYEQLFLNKAVMNPLDPIFNLNPAGDELADPTKNMGDHIPALLAALGISEADLSLLIEREFTDSEGVVHDRLDLTNLSHLYRIVSLSKVLKLSIRDFLTLKELMIGISPYDNNQNTFQFVNPFDSTLNTLMFVEKVRKIRKSGFKIAELDYLLRHHFVASAGIAPTEESIALILDEIRSGLQKIHEETAVVPDPKGEITGKNLTLLKWDKTLIEQVIATLDGSKVYQATLPSMPADLDFPNEVPDNLKSRVSLNVKTVNNVTTVSLQFTGPMTVDEQQQLKDLSIEQSYKSAIDELFNAPRTFVSQKMKAYEWPTFSAPLGTLPDILFPNELKSKIYYDVAAKELRFVGMMTETENKTLLGLSDDPEYQTAINTLFNAPTTYNPEPKNQFLTSADASQLFDTSITVDQKPIDANYRFNYVLTRLLAYLRNSLSESLVKQKLGETLKLEGKTIEQLLTQWVNSPTHPTQKSITEFLAPAFAESNPNVKLTADIFPDQFMTFTLLQKIATILSRLKITSAELPWILEHAASLGWLDLNALPLAETGASPSLFAAWEKLVDLMQLRDGLPVGKPTSADRVEYLATGSETTFAYPFRIFEESDLQVYVNSILQTPNTHYTVTGIGSAGGGNVLFVSAPAANASVVILRHFRALSLFDILDIAVTFDPVTGDVATSTAEFSTKLSARTGWSLADIETLVGKQEQATDTGLLGLLFPDDYKDGQALIRLRACFAMLKRLGVSASKVLEKDHEWTQTDVISEVSRSIKQAVKAKYDNEQWLTVAKPLRDVLREKQRSALVSYLVANPDLSKGQRWQDSNGLYEHFLIDVEMDPCMMTSRIKQAISSVQLFVQRCLMNLEVGISFLPEEARWWEWMKNYRVWEANRKVFLYPENWIEPELRDNKSPFFKDLENQLLQNEVTQDTAEDVFLNYLEKLDDVARLENVGMYHQVEYSNRGAKPVVDILHVFGRTRGTPHIYYYRQRVDSAYWTPWEKVDVDIEGDHLIPVVWNRRLHIFWPIFTEKAKDEPLPKKDKEGKKPSKYWELQIAWSEYKNGKWSAKKVSQETLSLEDYEDTSIWEKRDFTFKALFNTGNLAIRCYSAFSLSLIGEFSFTGCEGIILIREDINNPTPLLTLPRTFQENMMLVEDVGPTLTDDKLYLPQDYPEITNKAETIWYVDAPALDITPGTFRLLVPHQDPQFAAKRPFFYQDYTRTFFVIPKDVKVYPYIVFGPDAMDPNLIDEFDDYYFIPDQPIDPIGPVTEPVDPPIFEQSFPAETVNIGANAAVGGITTGSMMANTMATGTSIVPLSAPTTFAMISGSQFTSSVSELLIENPVQGSDSIILTYYTEKHYLFETFYHPYVCEFIRQLKRDGIDGLLQRANQIELLDKKFFEDDYDPEDVVKLPYPIDDVDFLYGGAYSLYSWELFFHAPLLIADRLSKNQRFQDAQKWFHYIFDPTDRSKYDVPQRFWKTGPFFENSDATKTLEYLMKLLAKSVEDPQLKDDPNVKNLVKQVDEWRDNPFNPHLIARLRITAYQKTVVMKYLDNLISWGDQLFRRDTIESINEATQLYILAAEILGKRPEKIPPRGKVPIKTYKQLEPGLDAFSNVLVEIENLTPTSGKEPVSSPGGDPPLPLLETLYFCIPKNDKLLGYWDAGCRRASFTKVQS